MKTSSRLYSEASGPIGSVEFARTAAGVGFRNKPVYKAPSTAIQKSNREKVVSAAVAWTGMTPIARESYRLAALRLPQKDKLGQDFYLTGWNLFCKRWFIFSPYASDLLLHLTLPINLRASFEIPDFPFRNLGGNGVISWSLTNTTDDVVNIVVFLSNPLSDFRTVTPTYKFILSHFFFFAGEYRPPIIRVPNGLYNLKIAIISDQNTWSTTPIYKLDAR